MFTCVTSIVFAQFSDDFEDGDFTNNPTWSGDTRFIVDNGVLRSNTGTLSAATNYYLSTPSTKATLAQWDFFINLRFATSGSNYVDIYLMSNNPNLNATNISGYFVRVGDTPDEISLYRVTNGTATKIIDGQDGVVGSSSNNPFNIRVRRDANNNWTLGYNNGTNTITYTPGGSVIDATHTTCTHFGIRITQSTAASVVNNHFFDNFVVGNIVIDNTPPTLTEVNVLSNNQLEVIFSEGVSQTSATTLTNYSVTGGIGNPTSATLSSFDRVTLTFGSNFIAGNTYTLSVQNVQDLSNNTMAFTQRNFVLPFTPLLNELLITEIMADPDPVTTILPNQEYFEIFNRTNKVLSLRNCRIRRNNDNPINLPNVTLNPQEYALVCANAQIDAFRAVIGTGKIIGLGSFPSLTNTGARLSLINANGTTVFTVEYSDRWYKNTTKANGGWSLEMIDTNNPCGEIDNWTASTNANGGTPAAPNSVAANNPDTTPPALTRADLITPQSIRITFSEKMDSLSLANANINISNGITISNTQLELPDYKRMIINTNQALQPRISYQITITQVQDCSGNTIGSRNQAIVGVPEPADSLDLLVNEILFNPRPNSFDFVEFYNNSDKFLNLKGWDLARIRDGLVDDRKKISTEDFLVAPRSYIVFTPDPNRLKADYPRGREETFVAFNLPSFNDDAGGVVLINAQNQVFQRFDYTEKMHSRLLRDREGVSLERISFSAPTNNPNSWQSAAATEGFATPGYLNSQQKRDLASSGEITISPKIITPNQDGDNDFATINYKFENGGGAMTIVLYDIQGREIKRIVENQTVGTEGFVTWDGTDSEGKKAAIGYYILWVEVFDLSGTRRTLRETIVVGTRF